MTNYIFIFVCYHYFVNFKFIYINLENLKNYNKQFLNLI